MRRVITVLRRSFGLEEPHPRTKRAAELHREHIEGLKHGRRQVEKLGNKGAVAALVRLEAAARRR